MKIIRALTDIHEKIVCLCSLSLSSSLFFFSLLLLSSFLSSFLFSFLFSCLLVLSRLLLSCLVSLSLSPCCVMWCVSLWWWCRCGRGVVGVLRHGEKNVKKKPCTRSKRFPCVDSKRPRVCRHQAHMLKTCGLGASTHGNVLNVNTESVLDGHTGAEGGSSPILLTKICPRRVITCPTGSPKVTLGCCPGSSSRRGREQHLSDSSNHLLYLMKLFNSS